MTPRARGDSWEVFAVITGGGTAGHVHPALAIGEALVAAGHRPETIRFVGSRRGIESRLVPDAGFELVVLPGRGIKRRFSRDNLAAVGGLFVAVILALELIARWRPKVVVTVGGYAGIPCSLAAIVLRIPIVVVNVDAVPGASNRLVAPFARARAVAFEGTPLNNSVVTGAPVRESVLEVARQAPDRAALAQSFGLDAKRTVVLVTGGSLGAQRMNHATLGLAARWAECDLVTIYHVAGDRNLPAVREEAEAIGLRAKMPGEAGLDYRLVGYEEQIPRLLSICELAVCRAGASTVAELMAIGTPSVLVPLPGAPGDHQLRNAQALQRCGAAEVVLDAECTPAQLDGLVASLLADPARLHEMSDAAARAGSLDAAARVARLAECAGRAR